jgi:hypothetical protein
MRSMGEKGRVRGLLVKPLGGMDLVALQGALVGVDAGELDVLAQVVAALLAEEAVVAGHAGLDGDAVAGLEVADALADAEDDAGGLVADCAVALEDERANLAGLPEVDVGAGKSALKGREESEMSCSPAHAGGLDVKKDLAPFGRQNGSVDGLEVVVGCDLERGVWQRRGQGLDAVDGSVGLCRRDRGVEGGGCGDGHGEMCWKGTLRVGDCLNGLF